MYNFLPKKVNGQGLLLDFFAETPGHKKLQGKERSRPLVLLETRFLDWFEFKRYKNEF